MSGRHAVSSLLPARQEELLSVVEELRGRLESEPVPFHANAGRPGQVAAIGVTTSAMGDVVAHLGQERDLESLSGFLARMPALDTMTAQNLRMPKAEHAVLQQVLRKALKEHPELSADEWLYVLAWVRRLLPRVAAGPGVERRSREQTRRADVAPSQAQAFFGVQLAAALRGRTDLPKAGDPVDAVLLEERTRKGGWRARHVATGIEGPIQNWADVPADRKAGDSLKLVVASATEREIAFRFAAE